MPSAPAATSPNAEPPKVPVKRETLRDASRLFAYLWPYRRRLIVALLALLVSTTLGLAFPYLMGRMIDAAQRPGGDIGRLALLALGALTAQAVITFFQSYSFNQAGQRALTAIRKDTYARLITLPMTFFAQQRVGELASRLSADLLGADPEVRRRHGPCARVAGRPAADFPLRGPF